MTDETMLKFSLWPFAALRFAALAWREYGFLRSLSLAVRELWHRSGYWMFLAPLYVATAFGIIFLALAVAVGLIVIGGAMLLQMGGLG